MYYEGDDAGFLHSYPTISHHKLETVQSIKKGKESSFVIKEGANECSTPQE